MSDYTVSKFNIPLFSPERQGERRKREKKITKTKKNNPIVSFACWHSGVRASKRYFISFSPPSYTPFHTHTHTQTHSKHCGVYIRKTSRRPFPVQEDNNNNKKVGLPNPTFLSLDNNRTHTILVKKKRRERRPYQRKIKRRAPLMKTERWRNRWLWGSL